ncbi:MAG: histidine kinase [Trueperaceae bacterium]|nr:histidine kinase [Trueperaceae bacterium]
MKRWGLSATSLGRPVSLLIALAIITVGQMVFVQLVKRLKGIDYFDLNSLTNFHIDIYDTGFFVKELIVPVALLFLLSGLPPFKRLVTGRERRLDSLLLFGALCLIQLAFFFFSYSSRPVDYEPLGIYFVVLAAGYLGGWRIGAGTALLAYALVSLRAFWLLEAPLAEQHAEIFFHGDALPLIWQGLSIGLLARLVEPGRFIPLTAFALGFLVELSGRFLAAPAQWDQWNWTAHILVISLISATALTFVALLVRNIQAGYNRQQAHQAELATARAELKALHAQINPHFIFNSLNTIRYFVRTEPDKARDLLLSLSEVFQRSLRSGEFVSLREELAYVEAYLALEKARLDERLTVQWIIPDERILSLEVPTLILQPLVENAIIHGLSPKQDGGTLSITIESWDGELVMQVRDNGTGFDARDWRSGKDKKDRASIGLANIDNRLRLLYGEAYGLKLESESGFGTRVQIKLPILTKPAILPKPPVPSLAEGHKVLGQS